MLIKDLTRCPEAVLASEQDFDRAPESREEQGLVRSVSGEGSGPVAVWLDDACRYDELTNERMIGMKKMIEMKRNE